MVSSKVLSAVTLTVIATVMTVMMGQLTEAHPGLGYEYPPIPYEFLYGVRDQYHGTDFGHEEQGNGGAVSGRYYVLLPDGRRQVVTYTADHVRGYVATVTYENAGFSPQGPTPVINSYF
nr:pro-resilin-like [Cherax quadricarinatus]